MWEEEDLNGMMGGAVLRHSAVLAVIRNNGSFASFSCVTLVEDEKVEE